MHDAIRKAIVEAFSYDHGADVGLRGPWHNSQKFDVGAAAWLDEGKSCILRPICLCALIHLMYSELEALFQPYIGYDLALELL